MPRPISPLCPPSVASDLAEQLFGFFHGAAIERVDANRFAPAIAAMLASYPEWVGRSVVNPLTGLPSRLKFFPSLAEVKDACDEAFKWERMRIDREALAETYLNALPAPQPPGQEEREKAVRYYEETVRPGLAPKHLQRRAPTADEAERRQALAHLEDLRDRKDDPIKIGDALRTVLDRWLTPGGLTLESRTPTALTGHEDYR